MNVHLLEADRFSAKALALLSKLGNVTFGGDKEGLSRCEVLFVRLGYVINADFILENCPKVKFILSPTTGHDHLDEHFIAEQGIRLISLRGEVHFLDSIPSTAEFTWALLMALVRKIPQAASHATSTSWNRDLFIGNNLAGKRIGILGFGRVGKQVARFAKAFGMEVHSYDIDQGKIPSDITTYSSFEEFAANIDILCIHIPMNEANRNWLNEARLSKLKKGVWIVNTSRGGIWDEFYLQRMLKENLCSGIATDVLADELGQNRLEESPLIQCSKSGMPIIITPHIAGATSESMHLTEEFVVGKLLDLIGG